MILYVLAKSRAVGKQQKRIRERMSKTRTETGPWWRQLTEFDEE